MVYLTVLNEENLYRCASQHSLPYGTKCRVLGNPPYRRMSAATSTICASAAFFSHKTRTALLSLRPPFFVRHGDRDGMQTRDAVSARLGEVCGGFEVVEAAAGCEDEDDGGETGDDTPNLGFCIHLFSSGVYGQDGAFASTTVTATVCRLRRRVVSFPTAPPEA